KTDGCARYMVAHVNGPPCDPRLNGGHRMAIIAPTQGDAVEACVNGPSGLKAHDPRVVLRTTAGGTFARWPNGAEAKLFGAHTPDDVERLRAGGNRCLVWFEEVAAQRRLKDAITHSEMGLRIGANPHYIASTTPKPRTELIELTRRDDVVVTRGRTRDAIHLPQAQRDHLMRKYAGTRIAAQELDGMLLEDIEGALWTRGGLDAARVGAAPPMARVVVAMDPAATSAEGDRLARKSAAPATAARELDGRLRGTAGGAPGPRGGPGAARAGAAPPMARVVVAMDPAATSGDESDEMGIIVAGRGQQYIPDATGFQRQHGYALDDLSGRMPPVEAARRAIRAYHEHRADAIVAEVNNGGEWIGTVIRQLDPTVNSRTVHASRGKVTRAEPVAALTEQGSAHIVGS